MDHGSAGFITGLCAEALAWPGMAMGMIIPTPICVVPTGSAILHIDERAAGLLLKTAPAVRLSGPKDFPVDRRNSSVARGKRATYRRLNYGLSCSAKLCVVSAPSPKDTKERNVDVTPHYRRHGERRAMAVS